MPTPKKPRRTRTTKKPPAPRTIKVAFPPEAIWNEWLKIAALVYQKQKLDHHKPATRGRGRPNFDWVMKTMFRGSLYAAVDQKRLRWKDHVGWRYREPHTETWKPLATKHLQAMVMDFWRTHLEKFNSPPYNTIEPSPFPKPNPKTVGKYATLFLDKNRGRQTPFI